jgi:hypothetical protein
VIAEALRMMTQPPAVHPGDALMLDSSQSTTLAAAVGPGIAWIDGRPPWDHSGLTAGVVVVAGVWVRGNVLRRAGRATRWSS